MWTPHQFHLVAGICGAYMPGELREHVRGHETEYIQLQKKVHKGPTLVVDGDATGLGSASITKSEATERLWAVCDVGEYLWAKPEELEDAEDIEATVKYLIAAGADAAAVLARLGPRRPHIRPVLTPAVYDLLRRASA